MLAETMEGLAYIRGHGGIRAQLAVLIVVGIVAKPVTDLLPGFAGKVFGLGAEGLAMLLTFHGMGATAAAIWLASRSSGLCVLSGDRNVASLMRPSCRRGVQMWPRR